MGFSLQLTSKENPDKMEVFSHYGIGIKTFAIERKPDGRVEFTLWFTFFFLPIFPLSSWSAIYAGPVEHFGIKEDGHSFYKAVRIQREFICYIQTVSATIVILAAAIAPVTWLIIRTQHRAATPAEMILVFASCLWMIVVVTLVERHRSKLLKGTWSKNP
jgi:hypothetical protein